MSSHVELEYDMFIKWVNRVDLNMTRIYLTSIHDLFINGLVASDSLVMLYFPTPTYGHLISM